MIENIWHTYDKVYCICSADRIFFGSSFLLRIFCHNYLTNIINFIIQPGHRVPRFSTINFGVCVPSSCSSNDVEIAMKHYTESFTDGTGVKLAVRVETEMCYMSDNEWMSKLDLGTKIAM